MLQDSFNKRINSNKRKHVLVGNELNELTKMVEAILAKDYSFLLGRLAFTGNDRFENMFVYQTTFKTIKYKYTRTEYINS